MATINPGIIIKPPFAGQRCDLDQMDVPNGAAYLLRNWIKRDGKFIVRPGYTPLGTSLAERALGMIQYDHHSGSRFTVIGTLTKWWNYDLGLREWVDITEPGNALTGTKSNNQLFRVFYKSDKTYVVGVNGHSDIPKCWDGEADTYSDVGGSPPKAKCLAICNNRMLLGNTNTVQPNRLQVDVSAFNNFEAGWGATQTVNLMDTSGEIVEMREYGNLLVAIYKTDAIYLANPKPDLEPFTFELKAADIKGPASPRAVVSTSLGHIYLALDGSAWLFNSISLTPLPDSIRAHILKTADLGSLSYAYGYYDARLNEVWFHYLGLGSNDYNVGIVLNLGDMTVWPVEFGTMRPTTGCGSQVVDAIRIGDMVDPLSTYTSPLKDLSHIYYHLMIVNNTGQVAIDDGNTDLSATIPFDLETGLVAQEDTPRNYVTAVESEHLFKPTDSQQNVDVQLGTSSAGEDAVYTPAQTLDLASTTKELGHRKTSRLFALRLSGEGTQAIQWRGSVVNGVLRGMR